MAVAPELLVHCLGRFSLGCRDAPGVEPRVLPLPATLKAQSLFAYLVVNRRAPHTRDHLAELFWGERPEHNARRSLATALWQIRRCLPPGDYLDAGIAAVALNPDCACRVDVAEFEHLLSRGQGASPAPLLQQAVDLYGGPFLDGFYDDWVLNERYRLEAMYCEALAQLMAARELLGQHEVALAVALRLLDQDPLREDAHRTAMRAYCRLGNRSAALAQYARCEQALQKELGAPPMAETLALRGLILAGQFEPRQAGSGTAQAVISPAPHEPAQHPLDVAAQAPLVGREQELQILADGWRAALAGECRLLLVAGESGVGKTRLVKEFAGQLRWQDACILEGGCYEFERLLPYQPLAEALESLPPVRACAAAAGLPAWVMAEVTRLAPGLAGREAPPPPPLAAPAAATNTQARLFDGVTRFLTHAARQQPLLLTIENLHWATDSTLQLLHHLARSGAGAPFLILGTQRLEGVDPAAPLATLGRRLEREGIARRLHLQRLSPAMVVALVGRMSGAGDAARPLADRLYLETEGNPFYLIQTLKALFEQGAIRMGEGAWSADYAGLAGAQLPLPTGVSETIAARAARLSGQTQDALRTAAVAGQEFDFELLKRAWGRGEEATLAALDELLRHRLLVEGSGSAGGDYAFTHHKIREVVYAGLPRHRRCYLHRKVGLALEGWLRETGGARPVELAHHFEQAIPLDNSLADKAIACLLQAGRQAERQSANHEALAYYRRGLTLVNALPEVAGRRQREVELLIALGMPTTVLFGYCSPEAREVYNRSRELCRQTGSMAPLFTSLVALARNYGVGGNHRAGLEIAEEALAMAESATDVDMLIEAHRLLSGVMFGLGRLKDGRKYCEAGLALYDPAYHERLSYRFGHDPAVPFLGILGVILWLQGQSDQALDRERQLAGLLPSLTQPTSRAIAYCWLAKQTCMRGDAEAAQQHAAEMIRITQASGLPTWTPIGLALHGWAVMKQGRPEDGLPQISEGISRWRAHHFEHFVPFLRTLEAAACLSLHREDEARVALVGARDSAGAGGDVYWSAEVERLQGELAQLAGADGKDGEACFHGALGIARGQGARMLELRAAISLARLWLAEGKGPAARVLLARSYEGFTEGFAAYDLVAARQLLAMLS